MSAFEPPVRILRRSPGRLRLALAASPADRSRLEQVVRAAGGVHTAALSRQTGNLLVTFDPRRIDERQVLEAVAGGLQAPAIPASPGIAPVPPLEEGFVRDLEADDGWLAAEGGCLLRASAAVCTAAILDFDAYPAWQQYVAAVEILERDHRGRGAVVRTEGRVGDQRVVHVMRYRYPSPTRVAWEQVEGELEAMRGEWRFRAAGPRATRAACRLAIRPGLRLRLLLRGPLYGQARDVLFAHALGELCHRVEAAEVRPRSR